MPSTVCVSAPSSELHKPQHPYIVLVVVRQIVYKQIVGVVLFTNCIVFGIKTNCGDVVV